MRRSVQITHISFETADVVHSDENIKIKRRTWPLYRGTFIDLIFTAGCIKIISTECKKTLYRRIGKHKSKQGRWNCLVAKYLEILRA